MKDRDISQLTLITEVETPTNIVINGVQVANKGLVVACPNCNNRILSFDYGDYLMVCEVCNQKADQLPKYCPVCGQRLSYRREAISLEELDAKV